MTSTDFVPQALEAAPKPVEMDERLDRHLRVHIENDGNDFDIETPADPWSRTHPQSGAHTEVPKLTRREARRRYRASKAAQRQLEIERTESRRRMLDESILPTTTPPATRKAVTPPLVLMVPSPPAETHEHEAPPAPPKQTPTAALPTHRPPADTHIPEPPPPERPEPVPEAALALTKPPATTHVPEPPPPERPEPVPEAALALTKPPATTHVPEPPPPETAESTAAAPSHKRPVVRAGKTLAFLALLCVTSMLWYFSLGTLVVSRGTALVSGWEVTSILTGSMLPALNVGDLVAFEPVDAADLELGQILVFDNPARPGVTLVHRLAAINSDGTYTTKGDANENADSTPVPQANIKGVVRMVSPYGGYPTMLLSHGRYLQFVALIGLMLGSALIVHGPEPQFMRRRHDRIAGPSAGSGDGFPE